MTPSGENTKVSRVVSRQPRVTASAACGRLIPLPVCLSPYLYPKHSFASLSMSTASSIDCRCGPPWPGTGAHAARDGARPIRSCARCERRWYGCMCRYDMDADARKLRWTRTPLERAGGAGRGRGRTCRWRPTRTTRLPTHARVTLCAVDGAEARPRQTVRKRTNAE
jgi:hypothetical protein